MTDSQPDLQPCLETAIAAARIGGDVLSDWRGRFCVREKSRANLVTEADEASQRAIHAAITDRFPEHGFLGEEGLNSNPHDSDWRWIIDPLDGTTNYVHGFPYYAVSIGLQYQGQLQVGVIYDPTRDELFTATRGGGAFLNNEPIQTSGETELSQALAMASLPIGADRHDPAVQRFLTALEHLRAVQRSGSAALNLAGVACGRIDVYWATSLHPWDVSAGVLLVQEAGGVVTNLTGDAVDILVPSLLAASSDKIRQNLTSILV